MRLIDADALMADLGKWLKQIDPTHPPEDNAIPPMEDIIVSTLMTIEEQPTIEPQRIRGKWIHDGYIFPHGNDWIHCSICGKKGINVPADLTNFCPNCGADMRGNKK